MTGCRHLHVRRTSPKGERFEGQCQACYALLELAKDGRWREIDG